MGRPSIAGTRWFSLSGRELLVLAVGIGLLLAAIGLAQVLQASRTSASVAVTQGGDSLPMPTRLNVNTAAGYELEMLPGIGPKTAEAIVQYREEHGPFASLGALAEVPGIGEKTIQKIRPHAMCAPPTVDSEGTD